MRSKAIGYFVAVAILFVLYVGTYFALVVPTEGGPPPLVTSDNVVHHHMVASYRIGGEHIETLFAPLQRADEWLFPSRWQVDEPGP